MNESAALARVVTPSIPTVNIVIDAERGCVWAEDPDHDTFPQVADDPFLQRAGQFIDKDHAHLFANLHDLTFWLNQIGAGVQRCWLLGETVCA